MRLALDDIKLGAGTQPRAKIDEATVADYAEAMKAGATFPPVIVFYDGKLYYLADGYHRVAATCKLGLTDIEADVRQGTLREAVYFSLGANDEHGLRRTAGDKRRAVLRMLHDKDWGSWPQGEIAKACRVSREFVNRIYQEISPTCDRSQVTGRDGRTINTVNIGKTKAPAPVVNERPLDDEPEPRPAPEHRFEPAEEEYAASMGPEAVEPESEARPDEPSTPPANAIRDLRNYIDVILDEIDSDQGRHYVVNETIKYLREKSIAFNKSA